ncbi:MAG: hypothetical protein ACQEQS_03820 [Thermodesulfobacteriota bacterium]
MFNIKDVITANGENIDHTLEKGENGSYTLTVINKKTTKGTYSDMIFLKTDSKVKSTLRINVFGNIK